ncbi:unnamed protein product [Microthlaspi erraticum]|uniref:Arabidopsis retrotransposon Orf1 C-terminal domain-containing protein n=1 Tax=Microthlaspi erraticum TaxID=1685480 RepID=A0A6D2HN92_9BRAS|nr:unnamed protein product [Microthlaspi erraticum]
MTNSEGSRASQRRMVEGESSNARERRLKMQADLERMIKDGRSDAEEYVYSEEESEKGSDETESEEEGEEVNQLVDESEQENQDEPWRRLSREQEEDELPMYQEHYNALFSMDFMETKYPHVDTMKALGIFEMWSWSQEHALGQVLLLSHGILQGAHLHQRGKALSVGGLITPILCAAGVNPTDKRATEPGWMDIKFCKTNLLIEHKELDGSSNSSSPSIGWPSKLLLPNPELTTVVRGENIDFRPPVYTLVGHEDDLREEEPELDRAEDRAESS